MLYDVINLKANIYFGFDEYETLATLRRFLAYNMQQGNKIANQKKIRINKKIY